MSPRQDTDKTLEAFGFKIPLPRPAVYALAAVVTVGIAAAIYQKVYGEPERVIVTLKDVNQQLAASVEEFGLHVMEEPTKHELFEDTDGALMLRVYPDHCVLIQRRLRNGSVLTKLVPDLARADRKVTSQVAPQSEWSWLPVLHAQAACNRGCLNPHPGPFKWWYGAQRGDWVEVWRQWPEGCNHFQLFHPRSGSWQTNPDGSPLVNWRCCVH